MIGKLKHSLKERCPDCGKILQVRTTNVEIVVKGEQLIVDSEHICCSNKNCDYEREVEQKRRRNRQEDV